MTYDAAALLIAKQIGEVLGYEYYKDKAKADEMAEAISLITGQRFEVVENRKYFVQKVESPS